MYMTSAICVGTACNSHTRSGCCLRRLPLCHQLAMVLMQRLLWLLLLLLLQADWFKQYQQSATEQVKGQLWSHWLPKCVDVFRRLPPVPINGDTEAYFRQAMQLHQHKQLADSAYQHCLAARSLHLPHKCCGCGCCWCVCLQGCCNAAEQPAAWAGGCVAV